ncbi:MAG: putative PEP-binding protein, partial [Alphaproteobacteria bacterium]
SRAEGTTAPSEVRLGSMLEIPSLLFQLPELMERVDFVSIGSNDLLQLLFACDRGSSRMTARYDPLHPAVLRAVRLVAEAARPRGVTVGFCGELSTRPIDAMALIAMGLRSLSMPPSAVGPVKAMIRTLDTRVLAGFLDYTMAEPVTSLRPSLERFARDHGVEIH